METKIRLPERKFLQDAIQDLIVDVIQGKMSVADVHRQAEEALRRGAT
jgi:hypothetical protein